MGNIDLGDFAFKIKHKLFLSEHIRIEMKMMSYSFYIYKEINSKKYYNFIDYDKENNFSTNCALTFWYFECVQKKINIRLNLKDDILSTQTHILQVKIYKSMICFWHKAWFMIVKKNLNNFFGKF